MRLSKEARRKQADQALDRARRLGFIEVLRMTDPAMTAYRDWCGREGRPFVWVCQRRDARYAEIWLDLSSCTWSLTGEGERQIEEMIAATRRRRDAVVYRRDKILVAGGIPSYDARRVAFELFDVAWKCRPID